MIRALLRHVPPKPWRRSSWDYHRFRIHTAYGDDGTPSLRDVLRWARWADRQRRQ